ncbi:hypothetical protein KB219_23890, partial [Pseudomonas aeruginosa]|nr:hypothetical protein [Pseudomonas aeruginosa]
YAGQSLMEILETVEIAADRNLDDMRFPVQYVNRPNLNFRGFAARASLRYHPIPLRNPART